MAFAWHGKLLKLTYNLADVTGSCPLLLFWKSNKSLNPPKCTCYMRRCVPSDGNVAVSRVRMHWLTCQDCSLNGCWREYDEQNLSWIKALGFIDSNQHDLPAGRCNVIESFPLEMAMSSLTNFPTNGFGASTTDVSRHRLGYTYFTYMVKIRTFSTLRWRHNGHDSV